MFRTLLLTMWGLTAAAQTQIDLRTQGKAIDFTAASSTKPMKAGTTLPATCAAGEMFFQTGASAGANLYGCPATNTWALEGGLSSENCWYDATDNTLKCRDSNGNIYAAVKTASSGTANQWVDYIDPTGVPHTSQPTAVAVGAVADPGANGVTYRSGLGAAAPANANQLSGPFFCQDSGAVNAYACNLTPAISAYTTGSMYWFRAGAANTGPATVNFNSLGPKAVVKRYNQPLEANDILAGQWVMVAYDGANMQMQSQTANAPESAVSSIFGRTGAVTAQAGDYSTAQVTENGNLYFTNARVRAALSGTGPVTLNASNGAVDCPTCVTTATAADTDLYGSFPHLNVVRLQGRQVSNSSPSDLQYLGWNANANQWEAKALPGPLVNSIFGRSGAITAQPGDYTTAQVTESGNLYFTNARARAALSGAGPVTLNASSGAVDCPTCVTTSTAADTDLYGSFPHLSVIRLQGRPLASGPPADQQYLGWNASANQWEPKTLPAAPVTSIFGRTGTITPQSGDYSFAQISGSASASQLPTAAMRADQGNTITAGTQDFSQAAHTLPMKSGTTAGRPAACTTGETYFATDAPAGTNVYACTSANAWTAQGNLAVESDGSAVGSRNVANFITGVGLVSLINDDGNEINIESALDTAVVQTQPGEQSGNALLCASASGSATSYTCLMSPTIAAYTSGMVLHWRPDVSNAGGSTTLNVDTLGAKPVKLADGTSDPPAAGVVAGRLYDIWYDGSAFRLSAVASGGGSDPCSGCITTGTVADTDLSGYFPHLSVTGIQGRPVASTAPSDSQYMGWNASASQWQPKTPSSLSAATNATPGVVTMSTATSSVAVATDDPRNTNSRTPTAHASSHQNGGSDEIATATPAAYAIPKAGSGGKLAQGWIDFTGYQTALSYTPENAANKGVASGYASLDSGGKAPIAQIPTGQTGSTVPLGNDARFSDARTPTAHASSHQNGGSDEIATATPAAYAIPRAGSGGKLAQGWIDFTGYQTALSYTPENAANKGVASGYASLDSGGKVPAAQIPAALSNSTSVNGTTIPASATLSITVASGTAALGTGAISSGACAAAVTVSASGVSTTDVIQASFNGDPTAIVGYVPSTSGMLTIIPYPTAGNVNFKVCNNSSAAITPGSITLNWRVTR
ncbi:MAG: hypothetical protein ABSC23_16600 [Bryobacteraceae bacterium]|jgi:hypothetical protein